MNTPQVAALTHVRADKLKSSDPRAVEKRQATFEKLVELKCFKRVEIDYDTTKVASILFVCTKMGDDVKARITQRGDLISNAETDTSTELPDTWLRILTTLYFLNNDQQIGAADVSKAYY